MREPVPLNMLTELHNQGLTPTQIAPLVGLARSTVSQRLHKAGTRPSGRVEKLPPAADLERLLKTTTARDLADTYGTTANSVHQKIREARKREAAVTVIRTTPSPLVEEDWDNVPCKAKDVDPDDFFPYVPPNQEGSLQNARRAARAVSDVTCRHCPLRLPCYTGALDRQEPWGVWGGVLFRNGKPVDEVKVA